MSVAKEPVVSSYRGIESSGGAGPSFVRPSTAGQKRKTFVKPVKSRVIDVTQDNLNALVNEICDLKKRSYYNQRLLKVAQNGNKRRSIAAAYLENSPVRDSLPSRNPKGKDALISRSVAPDKLVELNERIVLQSLDQQKTYYNSILENVKPKFKYMKRKRN